MPDQNPHTDPNPVSRHRFRPRATTLYRVALLAIIVGGAGGATLVFAYFHSPYWSAVGLAPDQPVLFSHRHHAGELRIDCRFCHATVETSAFAGMPATETCLGCHSQIFTDTRMLAPVIQSAATGVPLKWTRVTRLPDHVFFDHSIHIAKGVSCVHCHGDVTRMALLAKTHRLDMRECLGCHRDPTARVPELTGTINARPLTNCSTCHH